MDVILWIGSTRCEFKSIVSSIERASQLRRVMSLAEARKTSPPQLVLLAQARPGEFEASQVAELRAEWKGTRFVYVLGAWCCGQKRLNDEFSDVPTYYAHECSAERILDILGTKTGDLMPNALSPASGLVVVYSPAVSYREALADMLAQFGTKTVEAVVCRATRTHGVDAVVWHAPADFERRAEELQTLFIRHPGAQILALLTYPREFEWQRLHFLGVRVIAQPFELSDLLQAIKPSLPNAANSAA